MDEVDDLCSLVNQDFLNLDTIDMKDIFERKYKRLLTYYFSEYYEEGKLPIFIAFICHLVLEMDMGLFFPTLQLTGKYCGNWAVGYLRDKEFGDLITNRIQYSHGREGLADFYYNAYHNLTGVEISQFIGSNIAKIDEEDEAEEKGEETKSLLKTLLGASAATILLSTIAKFAERTFRAWLPGEAATQAMLSIGYLPGSLKFYGFCMEKTKRCPSDDYDFTPAYRESVPRDLIAIYDRVPQFVKLFVPFMNTTESGLLALASQQEGDKIWRVLQEFFWLITQPYAKPDERNNAWQYFVGVYSFTSLRLIKSCDDEIVLEPDDEEFKLDNDKLLITKKCLEIVQQEGVTIHDANIQILNDLIEKTN